MRFNFIGKIDFNAMDAKVPFYSEIKGKASGARVNVICIESKNNRAFLELAGFKNDPIKTMDTDNNKIDIAWEDRLDEESIKKVANYKKHVITLDEKRYEFISELDMVNFIKDHVDEIKDKRYQITGQVKINEYKGKLSDKFVIQNMYEVTDANKKNVFALNGDFCFNKDSIDTADWKNEKKIYLNGWEKNYISKDHPSVYTARSIVFDCSKFNPEDQRHVDVLGFRLKQIGCAYEDDKITTTTKLKKNKYYKIGVDLRYMNGVEAVSISESDLTENQKTALALGLVSSIEEFAPKGGIYGDRKVQYKLKDFSITGDYANGMIEEELDENLIYTPSAATESAEKAFADDAMNEPEEAESDDLFD